jgi:hypothetical protein
VAAGPFFFGGYANIKNQLAKRLYLGAWFVSFAACGTVCFANLYFMQTPFHNVAVDFLTAYVHVPAFQSWIFWRRVEGSEHARDMIGSLQSITLERAGQFNMIVRIVGWLVLITMIVMSGIVLCGYSLPTQLEAEKSMSITSHFMFWHGAIMWPIIPPVISSIFASYSMIWFFCCLHFLEIETCIVNVTTCVDVAQKENPEVLTLASEHSLNEFRLHRAQFELFLSKLQKKVARSQRRLNHSCNLWSFVAFHLLMFSWIQILVVTRNLRRLGTTDESYGFHWVFQDVFHIGGGATLVTIMLSMGTGVTMVGQRIKTEGKALMCKCGASKEKLSVVLSILSSHTPQFQFFGEPVNVGKCAPFVFATAILLFDAVTDILQYQVTPTD